jgi:antitoxin VapB
MEPKRAKVFWSGRSQAVRLPKEFRFRTDTVIIRQEGDALILEPADEWPDGYVESFSGAVPESFERLPQGETDRRDKLG